MRNKLKNLKNLDKQMNIILDTLETKFPEYAHMFQTETVTEHTRRNSFIGFTDTFDIGFRIEYRRFVSPLIPAEDVPVRNDFEREVLEALVERITNELITEYYTNFANNDYIGLRVLGADYMDRRAYTSRTAKRKRGEVLDATIQGTLNEIAGVLEAAYPNHHHLFTVRADHSKVSVDNDYVYDTNFSLAIGDIVSLPISRYLISDKRLEDTAQELLDKAHNDAENLAQDAVSKAQPHFLSSITREEIVEQFDKRTRLMNDVFKEPWVLRGEYERHTTGDNVQYTAAYKVGLPFVFSQPAYVKEDDKDVFIQTAK